MLIIAITPIPKVEAPKVYNINLNYDNKITQTKRRYRRAQLSEEEIRCKDGWDPNTKTCPKEKYNIEKVKNVRDSKTSKRNIACEASMGAIAGGVATAVTANPLVGAALGSLTSVLTGNVCSYEGVGSRPYKYPKKLPKEVTDKPQKYYAMGTGRTLTPYLKKYTPKRSCTYPISKCQSKKEM